jgi:hypothetical protein
MAIASTSRTRVAYIAEAAYGTTPATPTFLEIRRTGGEMRTKKTTVVSDEISLDRNIRDEYQVAQDAEGQYDFELTYGTFDDLLAGALFGSWTTNVLTNGSVEQSFTFEETVDLGGGSFAYSRFIGVEVDSLALNFPARKGVTGSIKLMGKQQSLATAIIAGATYTAPNTNVPETSVSVANLSIAGLAPAPKIKNLALNIANNLRIRDTVGSLYTDSFGSGQIDVTGSFDAYFESNALYQAVLDHGGGAISLTVGAVANKKYTIEMPVVRFLDGARRLGGKNDDVMINVPFRAIYDSGISGSIRITRAVA